MTFYNAALYLAEAINSVLAQQTSRPWELILVDDGSTDSSLQVAQRFALRHQERIALLHHPDRANRGISASRNLALHHARGQYLAFLDADDVLLPHHLHTLAGTLDRHPEVAMVYSGAERWVHFDQPYRPREARSAYWGENYLPPLVPQGQNCGLLQKGTLLTWFLQDESLVPCICAVMVRRSAALHVEGFEAEFKGLFDDQVFHAKISEAFPIFALDDCVARYRQHQHSCCARGRLFTHTQVEANTAFRSWLTAYQEIGGPVSSNEPA